MIVTTSQAVEGKIISEYLGIVSAASIAIMPIGAAQGGWKSGVDSAIEIMIQQAKEVRADAIIAVQFEPSGSHVCATGTAVRLC